MLYSLHYLSYSRIKSTKRACSATRRPPHQAIRNSGFAHALYPPSYDEARHSSLHRYDFFHINNVSIRINSATYIILIHQVTSISSREHVTFVATPKSSNSIVHSSRSGSAASRFPVIPAKAPSSTLT